MADNNAKITMDGKEVDLPIKTGTIGPDVVDIGTLYKNTGAFHL
jgi:citrate synthase